MKARDLAPLLRLRHRRTEAAERLLAQAVHRCTDLALQRDRLSVALDQAEEERLTHSIRLRSAGAKEPAPLHEILSLVGIYHARSHECRDRRGQLQSAIDACTALEKERQTCAIEHRQLHQSALKLEHILRQQTKKWQRRCNLATESETEEDFRALRPKTQIRPINDA